ncbi:hypothetical protein L9W92_01155 [Pelotomaculum terephthalicicum JT]|uniref:hypothetical protein n=1 Tax=Pelotomaculum terephthalicicum TaxID=206393 RepID=UPI001F035A0C|nr:hypothetical protein [Pelotomaculum terephthalicicum]MCG9966664.1 hypothetical protein [Pelotomaculum terephthalicicum JT]
MRFRLSFCIFSCFIIIHLLFIASLNNAETNDAGEFTIDHIIPHIGGRYSYTSFLNSSHYYDFVTDWQEQAPGIYRQTHNNKDGSQDYAIYQVNEDTIIGSESGFALANGEGSIEKTIAGTNFVFQRQSPGGIWVSQYKTIDSYNNITEYKCACRYMGLEKINILGQDVQAAKVIWEKESTAARQSLYSEWGPAPFFSKGEDWYVEGMGLVKRTCRISYEDSQELSCVVLLTEILAGE